MEKQKLYDFTDKIVECLQHKNAVKQVYELQKVVNEIYEDGRSERDREVNVFLAGDISTHRLLDVMRVKLPLNKP